jgi:hypothetical protein
MGVRATQAEKMASTVASGPRFRASSIAASGAPNVVRRRRWAARCLFHGVAGEGMNGARGDDISCNVRISEKKF